ncbi:MAG: hypothetical protein PHQ10_03145 [Dehalococcoidales bacterium]|jgi:hypothetical protein|nr:hypothetical protein [Dehalococcoidales bacterium]MDD4322684.1 hypothetical protein [Dehalococcoidales bacterium]MDD4794406.1 hypothetical protein [Dehalococcoidales bacterium]MDD5498317.1 hypothetical protein [Dehalococcoidales bacterium]MDX9803671.1 hypothetical protein [Dehalococcoidales bacterium]
MKTKGKIILAAVAALIVVALFAAALTDRLFFATFQLDQGEITENPDGSVEIPFYLYKDAWDKYQANIVNLTFGSEADEDDMVLVTLHVSPSPRYYIDSLKLEFYVNNIYSAIRLADPVTGEDLPYNYQLGGDDSKAVLDFPSFDIKAGEQLSIRFWLDLSAVTSIAEGPVLMDFSMHENSVFKLVRHAVKQHVLQFNIP